MGTAVSLGPPALLAVVLGCVACPLWSLVCCKGAHQWHCHVVLTFSLTLTLAVSLLCYVGHGYGVTQVPLLCTLTLTPIVLLLSRAGHGYGTCLVPLLYTVTLTPVVLLMCHVGHGYGMSLVPLLYTLKHTMVRHTKAQTISGQSVLALPEKTDELVPGKTDRELKGQLHVCPITLHKACA